MEVKTYRAASMQEALTLVRRDLGPQAAVLHTREIRADGLYRLLPSLRRIEVVAAADVNVPSRMAPVETVAAAPASTVVAPQKQHRDDARHDFGKLVQGQLTELQSMVEDLCRRSRGTGNHDLPESLFKLYADLIDADMSESLARELVEQVRGTIGSRDLDDTVMLQAHVARIIEQEVKVSGPIRLTPGQARLVALVGPTGVGKTTTIAKLAANYRLREKRKVGLITVDTYRIAAVEQLRTYADIIDLPMQVVSTPREMREAVRGMQGLDLILLDTAGRSPKDEVKIQELRSFLAEAAADEVHLVLSAVAGASTLERTAERFAVVGTTSMIVTKLDEASALGSLVPLVRGSRLPLSYVTNGQNVPDDIAVADSARLARAVLNFDAAA